MDGFRTVGHPAAIGAVRAMLATHVPHAVLLTGPASVGKHALALDLAAGLLCAGATGGDRPCRSCRACRMVEHGNHPDLHRLEPEGPGGQVGIGGKDGRRGVRDLVTELSLLPVEGVARVAIIRDAHRMNDDAQSALLKTLEEPPAGTTLILVADDEERLLPTVRSRCARIRLGTLGARDIEALLDERGPRRRPDRRPPRASRRWTGGPRRRLRHGAPRRRRSAASSAGRCWTCCGPAAPRGCSPPGTCSAGPARWPRCSRRHRPRRGRRTGRGRGRGSRAAAAQPADAADPAADDGSPATPPPDAARRAGRQGRPPSERRRALALLLDAVARPRPGPRAAPSSARPGDVRDVALLEELEAAARALPDGAAATALARLVRATELVDANVSPELVLDVVHPPLAADPGRGVSDADAGARP